MDKVLVFNILFVGRNKVGYIKATIKIFITGDPNMNRLHVQLLDYEMCRTALEPMTSLPLLPTPPKLVSITV